MCNCVSLVHRYGFCAKFNFCSYIPCTYTSNNHRLSFEVAEGGFLDVDVTLTDPSGSVIYAANQVHN